jgi:hypothetical protein
VMSDTRKDQGTFDFRSAELNFLAAIDPFANLYAVINANKEEVEVEEAAFITTSLPWNLQVRGGRFFANFGRLPHWHPHEYPFVNSLASIDTFIGGESQGDGAELIHLFKTPFFLQGTLGFYNKIGAENERLDDGAGGGHLHSRPWNANTYLQRLFTYVPLGDVTGIDVGVSNAVTPRQYYIDTIRQDRATPRWLSGLDLTFRYEPTGAGQVGRLIWGTEVFRNDERVHRQEDREIDTDADNIPDATETVDVFPRHHALGGYSYVDYRFARRFSGGGFFDMAQDLTHRRQQTNTWGTMINFLPSEFQRIRLQYSQVKVNDQSRVENQVFLQWFAAVGTHVHVFKDR